MNVCHSMTGVARGDQHPQQHAAERKLRVLSVDLGTRGYTASVLRNGDGSWGLSVHNPSVPDYSDLIYASPDEGGAWWLWWSWNDRLTLIDDIDVAAEVIASVLEPLRES